ncbi:muscarinic acetylcholine receptor [Plakobranchus ocellatus]|uniref:Muscarinic acetylcholine receptor n=1 Tax=Plakobranchus ocellatus TaxID=259542 RepID=A0AAV4AZE9_9GAST|nr:muscarinic acetylcholine receptor [Plakobranchus ocellatus]
MNLSTSLAAARADAVEMAQQRDITLLFFMGFLSLVGIVVNSLLLDVYLHTRRKVLSTYFISALAAMDLIICVVVMPLRMMLVLKAVPAVVCGLCLSVSYACIGVSLMLFFCITFDRYQAVCLLQRPLITHQTLHFVAGWAFMSAAYAGIIAPIYLKGEITVKDEWPDLTGNQSDLFVREVTFLMREGYPCYITSMLSNSDRVWDARFIVQFGFAVCCGSLIVLVLVLYFFMFHTLRQKDQFRLQSTLSRPSRQATQELRARPCCDLESISAISVVKAPQESNDCYENVAAETSNDASSSSNYCKVSRNCHQNETVLTREKQKQKREFLFPYSHRPRHLTVDYKDGNESKECLPLESTTVTGSSLQSIDLFKFRKRLVRKVGPIRDPQDWSMKEATAENNKNKGVISSEMCNTNLKSSSVTCKSELQTEHNNYNVSRGKKCNNRILGTTLACFRKNSKNTKQRRFSHQSNMNFELSTDGPQSDPEPCCYNPNQPVVRRNSFETLGSESDNPEDWSCFNKSSKVFDLISLEQGSFSSPTSESTAKSTNSRELCIKSSNVKKKEEKLIIVRGPCKVAQNSTTGLSKITQDAARFKTSKGDSMKPRSGGTDVRQSGHIKTLADPLFSVKFQTLRESSSDQDEPPNNVLHGTGRQFNAMAITPKVLTITIQTAPHTNSCDAILPLANSQSTNDELQTTDNTDTIHDTNSELTKHSNNTVEANMATLQESQHLSLSRRKCVMEGKSTCFQWSLSIRVTARLCLLTLTYCLWWLPFYLTELGLVDYQTLMPEIMFMANVMNPLLHLLTSQMFRRQAKARINVYLRLLASRRRPKPPNK